jgi:site-specific recombinase XerD
MFFTDRLTGQRHASPHTVAAYRDTFKLLLGFAARTRGKTPSDLDIADLHADTTAAFLDHLQAERGNSVAIRNARLAAIRSLFRFAALRHPERAATCSAMPPTRPGHWSSAGDRQIRLWRW